MHSATVISDRMVVFGGYETDPSMQDEESQVMARLHVLL
jgi:hypothetical protein